MYQNLLVVVFQTLYLTGEGGPFHGGGHAQPRFPLQREETNLSPSIDDVVAQMESDQKNVQKGA